ncbi:hypothetical protein SAMN05444363_1116 [Flavobacterium terrae]|uniref:Uncharacterized protein n=1 Tax=Flavobacterium terrae TaxID=415425 RepID=A0A1M6CV97_9FLAO|nr:hypothetical protein SAMN05444363_1116 [Flavobacterium terrae]
MISTDYKSALSGKDKQGIPSITGISSRIIEKNGKKIFDSKGSVVIYKGGVEIKRMSLSNYKKKYKK